MREGPAGQTGSWTPDSCRELDARPTLTDMVVLVVDDNTTNLQVLMRTLTADGFANVIGTSDGASVAELCERHAPDVLLLDLYMPGLTGFDVLEQINGRLEEPEDMPVLVLTADTCTDACHRALALGARDFVTKPINHIELLLRVRNLLRSRQLQRELHGRNAELDNVVRIRTLELEQARLESLNVLATMAEYHDYETHSHTQRVGLAAAMTARALGLSEREVDLIRQAAPLHDVGKVGVSDTILLKPGRLTDGERALMMHHVEIGGRILERARSPVLRTAAEIARTHHERWDGAGYLAGLCGDEIPLSGRITAVADVYDALTHDRPYKLAWEPARALDEVAVQAGRHFDPQVVEAFLSLGPTDLRAVHVHSSPDE